MLIMGVDPSLTNTGVALLDTDTTAWFVTTVKSKPPTLKGLNASLAPEAATMRRLTRIAWDIGDWAHPILLKYGVAAPDLVVIEGPAFSKNNGMAHERAGLWWQLYGSLQAYGSPILVVKPNVRAMYATGRGNAGKDEVLLAVSRRYPAAPVTDNNQADAVVLAAMGARGNLAPIEDRLPAAHLRAMKTVAPA